MSRHEFATISHVPIAVLQEMLWYVPNLSAPQLVSSAWLKLCHTTFQQSEWHQANRCRGLAERLGRDALWFTLLNTNNLSAEKPTPAYSAYLQKIVGITNTIEDLSAGYAETVGGVFDIENQVALLLKQHRFGAFGSDDAREKQRRQKAAEHLRGMAECWRQRLAPGTLRETAKSLIQRANQFKTLAYEKQLATVLSEKRPDFSQGMSESEAKKYRDLYLFIDDVSAFEAVLLEFSLFIKMRANCVFTTADEFYAIKGRDLSVLTLQFLLPRSPSRDFYWHYIGYIAKKNHLYNQHYIVVLKNPNLSRYLFDFKEDDQAGRELADKCLLEALESLWAELPAILQANPELYERMRPELWVALGEKSCNYIRYFFQDRKIYGSLNSQQLRELVSENRGNFEKLKKEHRRDILSRIEILDLSYVRYRCETDEGIPVLILEVIQEKIKIVKSIDDLEKLKNALQRPTKEEYDKPILESLEAEIRSRRQLVEEKNATMQDVPKVLPAIESDQQSLTENASSKAELPEPNSPKHSKPQANSQKPISESLENSQTNPVPGETQPRQEEPNLFVGQKQATASQKPIPQSLETSQTNPTPAETQPQQEKPNPSIGQKQAADTSPKPQPQSVNKNSAEQSQKPRRKRRRKKDPYLKALCSRYASVPRFIDYNSVKEKRAKTVISELSQQVTDYHKGHKRLVEIAKDDTLDFDKKWPLIQEECKSRLSPVTRWSSQLSLFGRPGRDKDRDLLYRAILNFDQLIESNTKIKTLLQLLMAQQKQDVMELCETERARLSGEDRDKSDTTYFGCIPYKNNSSRSKIAVYEQLEQDLKDSEADESVQDVLTDMPADTMNTLKGARSRLPLGSVTSSDVLKEIQSVALPILPLSNAF